MTQEFDPFSLGREEIEAEPQRELLVEPLVFMVLTRGEGEEEEVLILQRGNGNFSLPSGHVENGEGLQEAASRELEEETGVFVHPEAFSFAHVCYLRTEMPAIAFFFRARVWLGDPYNAEPEKHLSLEWRPLNKLPEPFVTHTKLSLENIQNGVLLSEFPPQKVLDF